jgi:imidazolonepropionase-like amidohydrolase
MYEIEQMAAAGTSPMDVVVASTRNAAHVAGLESELGTPEVGKMTDVQALRAIRVVVHGGVVIRDERA